MPVASLRPDQPSLVENSEEVRDKNSFSAVSILTWSLGARFKMCEAIDRECNCEVGMIIIWGIGGYPFCTFFLLFTLMPLVWWVGFGLIVIL